MSWKYYPKEFSSYEEYVKHLKEKGLALEAPEECINLNNKIMDYEKKYKEALERAKSWAKGEHPECFSEAQKAVDFIFPELKESEDERIRKEIIRVFKGEISFTSHKENEKYIAWLEKQCEPKEKPTKRQVWDYCNKISSEWWQITMDKWTTLTDEDKNKYNQFIGFNDFSDTLMNITAGALFQLIDTGKLEYEEGNLLLEKPYDTPKSFEIINAMNEKQSEWKLDDKVEPKFKTGDWILIDNPCQIESMDSNGNYIVQYCDSEKTHLLSRSFCNSYFHLWTIQDANDGDVLVDEDNNIGIYKEIEFTNWNSYIYLGCDGKLRGFSIGGSHKQIDTHPATKEQRDLLFRKIKEAGYEWDSEKKELNKIEHKLDCGEDDKDALDECYISFETAKLLNEKGFKQECYYATSWYANQYYKNSCQGEWFEGEHQIIDDIDDKCNISYLSSNNIFIPAPTQQMVMKWLREVHGIHISVVMGFDVDNPQHFFFATNICKFSVKTVEYQTPFPEKEFDTYELACEETIKYCIENLI